MNLVTNDAPPAGPSALVGVVVGRGKSGLTRPVTARLAGIPAPVGTLRLDDARLVWFNPRLVWFNPWALGPGGTRSHRGGGHR